ncbi:hypothetical protein niasHT_033502 [Heterodera trifolii]|uniref:Uncharacterized protein n=1 Tax=Heterodera trifolii TaxID=157864 RepID=A0ABD2J2W1_9BILA
MTFIRAEIPGQIDVLLRTLASGNVGNEERERINAQLEQLRERARALVLQLFALQAAQREREERWRDGDDEGGRGGNPEVDHLHNVQEERRELGQCDGTKKWRHSTKRWLKLAQTKCPGKRMLFFSGFGRGTSHGWHSGRLFPFWPSSLFEAPEKVEERASLAAIV